MAVHHSWATAFGLLGNITSFLVCLAPLPTFYKIYRKKSAEGFQSIPYVISLFSAMLWIYYALLKENSAIFLVTINTFCCFIQTIYIALYIFYAPSKSRIQTVKFLMLLNVFGFGALCLSTFFLAKGAIREKILGYVCMAFALGVFAAPLCILRKVIKTKSVEYMPFTLSFFLTVGAVAWFFYGLLIKDLNVAIPNVLGFIFGVLQMILYVIYRNPKDNKSNKVVEQTRARQQLHELSEHVVDVVKLSTMVCSELNLNSVVPQLSAAAAAAAIQNTEIEGTEIIILKKQSEDDDDLEAKQNSKLPDVVMSAAIANA